MAGTLPTPQKTWLTATVTNTLTGSDVGNQKDIVIKIKNQRKTWLQTVLGSSTGTAGALDGTDRWVTTANIPNGTGVPWFAFTNGNGSQDCLSYANSGQSNWTFVHSPGGLFTGGSSTARPTATDETVIYGSNSWFGRGSGGANPAFRCNMQYSTDGQCLRFQYWTGGIPFGNIFYETVDQPTTGWTAPNVAIADKFGNDAFADQKVGKVDIWMNELGGAGTGVIKGWGPSGAMQMTATTEGTGVGNSAGVLKPLVDSVVTKNAISSTYRFMPRFGMLSVGTDHGWHGRLYDLWAVPHAVFTTGSTLPLDGSKQFVIIGDQMLPWAGASTAYPTS